MGGRPPERRRNGRLWFRARRFSNGYVADAAPNGWTVRRRRRFSLYGVTGPRFLALNACNSVNITPFAPPPPRPTAARSTQRGEHAQQQRYFCPRGAPYFAGSLPSLRVNRALLVPIILFATTWYAAHFVISPGHPTPSPLDNVYPMRAYSARTLCQRRGVAGWFGQDGLNNMAQTENIYFPLSLLLLSSPSSLFLL